MSTRVDKGGPKFKPVLKSKARPSATPAPPDVRARPSAEPSASMPPPSIIPERAPSVVPSTAPAIAAPSNVIVSDRSMRPSKPKTAGVAVVLPSSRPVMIQPTRATPAPISEQASTGTAVPIASTSRLAQPSRGVPIAPSRLTPAPPPNPGPMHTPTPSGGPPSALSKGKKRVVSETEQEATEDDHPDPTLPTNKRGGATRKRPKLSIVQADEARVKGPTRAAKAKEKAATSGAESGTTGENEGGSGADVPKKKRAPRKKIAKENAEGDPTVEPSRPKRKYTKRAQTQEDADEDTTTMTLSQDPDFQSESSEPAQKPRKKRQRTETVEPEGTPEPIDPTQVTMSAICDDLGSGRVSSRWETSQVQYIEARKRAREDRARAVAEAAEEERETGRVGAQKGATRPTLPTNGKAGEESIVENTGEDPDEFTYNESLKASHYAPQVRIGANGEIVLDMESLQVDRAADPENAEDAYSFVEESDQSKFTNSNSWSKRRSVRWGKEDTAMFYDALRQFGQNFDLIARVLPGRTYRMCRNKFKAEDKKNPGLIDDALRNGVAVDINTLSRMTGKDFSGPTPVITAKKVLDLGEHDTLAERTVSDGAETHTGVPEENETTRTEGDQVGDVQDKTTEIDMTTGQSVSSPPAETLLSTLDTARQSASSPPAESILNALGFASRNFGASDLKSSGPVTISAPTRSVVQGAVPGIVGQPSSNHAVPSASSQRHIITEPPAPPVKKRGKKQAAQDEGVEVLGLVEDHVDN